MNKIYLHKKDLHAIIDFMGTFDQQTVEISYNTSSGIGAVVEATLRSVEVKGTRVNVNIVICDESDW